MDKNSLENIERVNDIEENSTKSGLAFIVIKKILSFIFSVLYFISLNAFIIIVIFKMSFSNGFISDLIKMVDENSKDYSTSVTDLAYVSPKEMKQKSMQTKATLDEDDIREITEKYDFDEMDFDEIGNYFEDTVTTILDENNIPKDVFAYLDEDEKNMELLGEIGASLIEYTYGLTDELDINEKKVEKLINNAINNYERETGSVVDRSKVSNAVNVFTDEVETFVEDHSDNQIREIISTIFNGKIFYLVFYFTLICLVILILLNLKDFRFLKTVGVPTSIIGITYLLIGKFAMPSIDEISKITSLTNSITKVGTIVTVIAIVLLIIYYVIKYKKKESGETYA